MRKYIRENNAAPASDDTAAIKQSPKQLELPPPQTLTH